MSMIRVEGEIITIDTIDVPYYNLDKTRKTTLSIYFYSDFSC